MFQLSIANSIFSQNIGPNLLNILSTHFSKTHSSSIFLNKGKPALQATRTFTLKGDSLFIYTFDPQDAISNAPLYDTLLVFLPTVAKIKIEKGNGSFGEKGLGLSFVPKVYQTVDSKKMGNKSHSDVMINEKDINQVQGANVTQKLAGQAAGVFVGGSPTPGTTAMVRIRGVGSINANSPLYIVDDVPISQQNINTINPEDIEKVEVLKDASATALYGVRGANGVIKITTKKGGVNPSSFAQLPATPITLWIWGDEVKAFQKADVQKSLKELNLQLGNR